jgi:methylenetetrahydrofolate dehydrogenase (NADP+)/methenyltetrahydrofolate cyclohydrolase
MCSEDELRTKILSLNTDREVKGIMVQLPLPKQLRDQTREILDLIDPNKDVDCLTAKNLERLEKGNPKFYPATVKAILSILGEQLNKKLLFGEGHGVLKGKNCVVVGASDLVGKPTVVVLKNLGASVIICDEFTSKNEVVLACQGADILVSATGVGHLIKREMVKPGVIVIDVGISRDENGKLIGDVDFEEVSKVASYVSPVPGGVGPRTVESLLENFLQA